jgi:hypothetical protein
VETAIVLSVVGEGMPLIYNGQEAGLTRRLAFFEKDRIGWKPHPMGEFYRKLFTLKHENTALWNGHWGARMIQVPNSTHLKVLSFVRQNEVDKVFAVLNFSAQPQTVAFRESLYHGEYTDFFRGERVTLDKTTQLMLTPWGFKVYVK